MDEEKIIENVPVLSQTESPAIDTHNNRRKNKKASKSSKKQKGNPGSIKPAKKKNSAAKHKKKPSAKRSRMDSWILTVLLFMLLAAFVVCGIRRISEYNRFKEMKAAVGVDYFYPGTVIDKTDVSGMTMDEVLNKWNNEVETGYSGAVVTLSNGITKTAAELGYSSDYIDVLSGVWETERRGSIEERYNTLQQHETAQKEYNVHRTLYDDAEVRKFVDMVAEGIDEEPKNAALRSFNTDTYQFEYEDGHSGKRVDREKLVSDIEMALRTGGGSVTLEIQAIEPEITRENVAANYGMISSAITNASSSNSNRLSNIKLALSFINGTEIKPGDEFSFNAVVGKRESSRGFKKAPAYSGGEVMEEIGGGICQVSTTVFNAAVKANMKIKERHPHSMPVSYVDPGKDAAVDWGNKDLRFVNNSDESVYICCYLTDDKRVRVGVFGKLIPDGKSIVIETDKTKGDDYTTDYRVNFEMAPGATKVVQKGRKGAKATTYKVVLDADGNEISREEMFKSSYKPEKEIIEYGPN